jgi:Tfp pilus assembly protein PilN
MINLLPTEFKEDISYARRNTRLRRWVLASSGALLGIALIVAGGLLYLQKNINDYTDQVALSRQSLQAQKVDETQKRVEEISSSTKLTVQVLSREILFSKLIRQIGSALPSSTALNSLQIDKVQGGVQLNASAADFNAATQLQLNLQDPKNGVFEKADINSIDCATQADKPARYPCTVTLRALFGKNNSYVYINPAQPGANTTTGGAQR